jgi:hypothetical protein
MTFGHVTAPHPRLAARRRLAFLVPIVLGIVVAAVLWRAGERHSTPQSPVTLSERTRVEGPEPVVETTVEPAPPAPDWQGLERCLRQDVYARERGITVADVRRWVEVEHDPVWLDRGLWWFPLSGEGDPQMPSGLYVGVPLADTAPCAGAIMN